MLLLGISSPVHPASWRLLDCGVRAQDPGKARRLLGESKSWPRLVEQTPPWRRAEWWERQRLRSSLAVLVPVLLLAIRFLLRVWIHTR
jgi:hypothetical protein